MQPFLGNWNQSQVAVSNGGLSSAAEKHRTPCWGHPLRKQLASAGLPHLAESFLGAWLAGRIRSTVTMLILHRNSTRGKETENEPSMLLQGAVFPKRISSLLFLSGTLDEIVKNRCLCSAARFSQLSIDGKTQNLATSQVQTLARLNPESYTWNILFS